MRALLALAALPLVACTHSIPPIPTKSPILLGPIDRIGGKPTPLSEDAEKNKDDVFDAEEESGSTYCFLTLYPIMSNVGPASGAEIADGVHAKLARQAGPKPLRDLSPRASAVRTGAWVFFLPGCFSNNGFSSARGTVEVPK